MCKYIRPVFIRGSLAKQFTFIFVSSQRRVKDRFRFLAEYQLCLARSHLVFLLTNFNYESVKLWCNINANSVTFCVTCLHFVKFGPR